MITILSMCRLLGPDKRYPIDNHWKSLTQQVIDSIVRQSHGRPVIGLGHSLGSVLSFQASLQRPELFSQMIMLDPPMIMGKEAFALHIAKTFRLKALDQMSPAGLSKRRRDHWESREQAAELLRPKGFYQDFDADCFQAYIDYALKDDPVRGGVELTIPKMDEVNIFRTNPSLWWLPQAKTKSTSTSGGCQERSIFGAQISAASAKEIWHSIYSSRWWAYVPIRAA
jgi:Lysophospholipase